MPASNVLTGKALQAHLENEIMLYIENGLKRDLASLDAADTFKKTHLLLRALEEFYNLCAHETSVDEFEMLSVMSIDRWNHYYNNILDRMFAPRFGKKITNRCKRTVLELHRIHVEFQVTGDDLGYTTIAEAAAYFQSRRRHMVTVLYVIPQYCKGIKKLGEWDLLRIIVHLCEMVLINITALQRQLFLSYAVPGYKATISNGLLIGDTEFQILDSLFSEPERLSLSDPSVSEVLQMQSLLPIPDGKVTCINEFVNGCTLISRYLGHFEHVDPVFESLVQVLLKLAEQVKEDYFLSVSESTFEKELLTVASSEVRNEIRTWLTLSSMDFIKNSISYHPLIKILKEYKSNLNLMLRFLYYYKNVSLNQSKKFQIVAGFTFEENVRSVLARLGFQILKVKRIQRKEFDVVTASNGVLYNFQCKNNYLDVTLIDSNPKKYAKKNASLVRYFKKAILKEESRQKLLLDKFHFKRIRHFVVTRFPVVTDDPLIMSFSELEASLLRSFGKNRSGS